MSKFRSMSMEVQCGREDASDDGSVSIVSSGSGSISGSAVGVGVSASVDSAGEDLNDPYSCIRLDTWLFMERHFSATQQQEIMSCFEEGVQGPVGEGVATAQHHTKQQQQSTPPPPPVPVGLRGKPPLSPHSSQPRLPS